MLSQTRKILVRALSFQGLEISATLAMMERVNEARAAGKHILHMGFGEAPFPPAPRIEAALKGASKQTHYLPSLGDPTLRRLVLNDFKMRHGVDTSKFDAVITPGSKMGLFALQMAVPGDLIVPTPSWVSYVPQAEILGNHAIKLPMELSDSGMYLDPEKLKGAISESRKHGFKPTKIILNYPNNPTGLVHPVENLKAVAAVCEEEDILILSDEIYGQIMFDGVHRSIAEFAPKNTVVFSGISKFLALGGWRMGFALVPKSIPTLIRLLAKFASEMWSCISTPVSIAAMEAFQQHPDVDQHVADCTKIHRHFNLYINQRLKALPGVEVPKPQGAFYNMPRFNAYREKLAAQRVVTSHALANMLMRDYNLASLPGASFNEPIRELSLRLSGCDYNGAKVLAALRAGEALDEAFVKKNAPNIYEAMNVFEKVIESCGGKP